MFSVVTAFPFCISLLTLLPPVIVSQKRHTRQRADFTFQSLCFCVSKAYILRGKRIRNIDKASWPQNMKEGESFVSLEITFPGTRVGDNVMLHRQTPGSWVEDLCPVSWHNP